MMQIKLITLYQRMNADYVKVNYFYTLSVGVRRGSH